LGDSYQEYVYDPHNYHPDFHQWLGVQWVHFIHKLDSTLLSLAPPDRVHIRNHIHTLDDGKPYYASTHDITIWNQPLTTMVVRLHAIYLAGRTFYTVGGLYEYLLGEVEGYRQVYEYCRSCHHCGDGFCGLGIKPAVGCQSRLPTITWRELDDRLRDVGTILSNEEWVPFTTDLHMLLTNEGFDVVYQPTVYPHNQYLYVQVGVGNVEVAVCHRPPYGTRILTTSWCCPSMYVTSVRNLVEGLHRITRRQALIEHCGNCYYCDPHVGHCGMGYELDPTCQHIVPKVVNNQAP
jgi:hypothetical protein